MVCAMPPRCKHGNVAQIVSQPAMPGGGHISHPIFAQASEVLGCGVVHPMRMLHDAPTKSSQKAVRWQARLGGGGQRVAEAQGRPHADDGGVPFSGQSPQAR